MDKASKSVDTSSSEDETPSGEQNKQEIKKADSESDSEPEDNIYKNITEKQVEAARKHNECYICQKRLSCFSTFRRHMLRHSASKKYKCPTCEKTFAEVKYLKAHMTIHSGTTSYSCKVCSKKFTSKSGYHGHMLIHKGEKRYKCKICDKAFTLSSTRSKHMLTHTGGRRGNRTVIKSEDGLTEIKETAQCPFCFKTISKYNKTHIRNHERGITHDCQLCDAKFIHPDSLRAHMPTHTGINEFKCTVCPKEFNVASRLEQHMRIHTGEKRYVCEICGRPFTNCSTLHRHRKIHDINREKNKNSAKNYLCDICSKAFVEKSSLHYHMTIHTGERPFACKVCPKAYRDSSSLSKHMNTHLDEKPFQCEICAKTFRQRYCLSKHLEMHEREHLLKDFDGVCEICSKKFATPIALKIHQGAVHDTNERTQQCQHCFKSFRLVSTLRRHIERVHINKAFECDICNKKAFATKEKLDVHREKHFEDKKILPCQICHQTFKTTNSMRKHLLKRHNIENELKIGNGIDSLGTAVPVPIMKSVSKSLNAVLNLSQSSFQRYPGHPTWL